jgi:hypothetical protein
MPEDQGTKGQELKICSHNRPEILLVEYSKLNHMFWFLGSY